MAGRKTGGGLGFGLLLAGLLAVAVAREPGRETAFDAVVLPIDDGAYLPAALDSIAGAENRIDALIYLLAEPRLREDGGLDPEDPVARLLDALADAHDRGVRVRVILDVTRQFWAGDPDERERLDLRNAGAARVLASRGVPVFREEHDRTTHAKLLVVDDRTVLLGSANWTRAALAYNREASVRIESPGVARAYRAWLDAIPVAAWEGGE